MQPPDQARLNAGLCGRCLHRREIRSDRGSVFFMCLRSFQEPEYPKYPRLPVLRCAGFDAEADETIG